MSKGKFDIVLLGGGHSHVEVIRQFGERAQDGVALTIIARDVHTPYSGMVPGYLAGHYSHADCHVDLAPLARFAGARLIHMAADHLDTEKQLVRCTDGSLVHYDLLSIDIGSRPPVSQIDGAAEHVIPVKPIDRLLSEIGRLEKRIAGQPGPFRVLVIGGGAGGVELALSLDHRLGKVAAAQEDCAAPEITIVDGAADILPLHIGAVRARMRRALDACNVTLQLGTRAARFTPALLSMEDGSQVPFDAAFLVTGAQAAGWLKASGLAVDKDGFVAVEQTLRSLSHANIFACGDVAAIQDHALPKAGVYAVRQGPILAENLRRAAQGQALKPYHPQRHILALISTGNQYAIASRGRLAIAGHWVWTLKDWIDRRWMARYKIS
ncbi:MAG: FAD-dependent oxidoreductase [Alphaproteobacteria bacterium]